MPIDLNLPPPPAATPDGRYVELGWAIAGGGEGTIHPVESDPSVLAKVLAPRKRLPANRAKLEWMVSVPPPAGEDWSLAWPIDLLVDGDDKLLGFLMPNIADGHPLAATTKVVTANAPVAPPDRLRGARTLARAVADLHDLGHVICDFSPDNVMVRQSGALTIVDCDSFSYLVDPGPPEVRHGSHAWRAAYSAPEVFAAYGRLDRHGWQDDFSLALTIFQWLMNGYHPFQGQRIDGGKATPSTEAMKLGWFPYAPRPDHSLLPPQKAPALSALPTPLPDLFVRCFVDAHERPERRPTAREWEHALASTLSGETATARPVRR
jgi:DNA-binding helix-hairpin-helix protein with protein kinase domain